MKRFLFDLAIGLVLALAVMLAGCADYNKVADAMAEKACSPEGQVARDAYRAARDGEYRTKDRAVCVRCPGEERLKCTGDPKALPET